jgi:hypothetical protein
VPKHIIEFNLPEEHEELKTVMDAGNMASVIYDWGQMLRNKTKYSDPDELVKWGDLWDLWYETLHDNKINT